MCWENLYRELTSRFWDGTSHFACGCPCKQYERWSQHLAKPFHGNGYAYEQTLRPRWEREHCLDLQYFNLTMFAPISATSKTLTLWWSPSNITSQLKLCHAVARQKCFQLLIDPTHKHHTETADYKKVHRHNSKHAVRYACFRNA